MIAGFYVIAYEMKITITKKFHPIKKETGAVTEKSSKIQKNKTAAALLNDVLWVHVSSDMMSGEW